MTNPQSKDLELELLLSKGLGPVKLEKINETSADTQSSTKNYYLGTEFIERLGLNRSSWDLLKDSGGFSKYRNNAGVYKIPSEEVQKFENLIGSCFALMQSKLDKFEIKSAAGAGFSKYRARKIKPMNMRQLAERVSGEYSSRIPEISQKIQANSKAKYKIERESFLQKQTPGVLFAVEFQDKTKMSERAWVFLSKRANYREFRASNGSYKVPEIELVKARSTIGICLGIFKGILEELDSREPFYVRSGKHPIEYNESDLLEFSSIVSDALENRCSKNAQAKINELESQLDLITKKNQELIEKISELQQLDLLKLVNSLSKVAYPENSANPRENKVVAFSKRIMIKLLNR